MGATVRITRGSALRDRARSYRVLLDGVGVSRVRDGQTVAFPVEAGSHTIQIRIDWTGSPVFRFEAQEGQTVDFECANAVPSLMGLPALINLFRDRDGYIAIRLISEGGASEESTWPPAGGREDQSRHFFRACLAIGAVGFLLGIAGLIAHQRVLESVSRASIAVAGAGVLLTLIRLGRPKGRHKH